MPTAITHPNDPDAVRQLATDVQNRHRSHLRELRIEVVEGGVILRGRAINFYGKQIAFHEVSGRFGLVVVANQVEVLEPAPL